MPDEYPILLLTGPPGAGKTTVAGLLAERFPRAAHIEADRFFDFIRGGFIDPWRPEAHEQNTVVMQAVASAAAEYASAGYVTIVDGILIPGWFFGPLRDSLNAHGHATAYAVLRAPLEVCLERAAGRTDSPLKEPAAIEQLWRAFADLGQFERHVVGTTDLAAHAVADHVAGRWPELITH